MNIPENTPMVDGRPMMMVRMRCPACDFNYRFMVEVETPLQVLPEIAQKVMRCKCRNHIPKIDKNTSLDDSLMSINAVPLRVLKERTLSMGLN